MGSDAQVGQVMPCRRVRTASCENGNGIAIAIQNANLTFGARVVVLVLIVGTTIVEDLTGAEGERMDLDVVSLAAGSGGEDSDTISGTNTNTNTSSSTNISTNNNSRNHRNHIHTYHSSRNSNSNRLHPLLRRRHLKLFSLFSHLPHHRSLRSMSVKVNILPHRSSNHTCRMGLTLIRHLFHFRILHTLMQA
jgi:hypothetical protein